MNTSGLWPVIRVTFLHTFGLSALRDRYVRRRERLWEPVLVVLAIAWGLTILEVGLTYVARGVVAVGAMVGQPGLIFALSLLAVQALALFVGVIMVISAFYFSDDLSVLVPLPVGPGSVVVAKFLTVLAGEYLTAFVIMLPAVIAYAPLAGARADAVWFWVFLLVTFVLAPVLPLALAAIAGVGLMRVINRRHRDLLLVLFSLAIVAGAMVFQFATLRVPPDATGAYLQRIMTERLGLITAVGRAFPPAAWAAVAIVAAGTAEGLAAFAKLAGASAVALLVLMVAGGRMFYGGLIGGQEVAVRRRRLSRGKAAADSRATTIPVALFWREWRLFMRVPLFVMNGFMSAVIVPFTMIFPVVAQTGGLGQAIAALSATPRVTEITTLAVAAVIAFMGGLNTTASTSISREGRQFWISKVIPVRAADQVRAKLLFALVGSFICAVPVVGTFAVVVHPGWVPVFFAAVIGVLASMVGLVLGFAFDLWRPFFKWTNPQQAVKNNLNAVFPMAVEAAIIGVLGFAAFRMMGARVTPLVTYALFTAVLAALLVVSYRFVMSYAQRRHSELDA
jgi:ABC-2 type transport system permease protein